jgi:hypothetical protein
MSATEQSKLRTRQQQPAPLLIQNQPVFSPEMARPDSLNDPHSPASIARQLTQLQLNAISYNRYAPPVPPPIKEQYSDMNTLFDTVNTAKKIQYSSVAFIAGTALIFIAYGLYK